jgi:para-aminobenzoate synthetase / 4-amino-4-deoxychorismate lyase
MTLAPGRPRSQELGFAGVRPDRVLGALADEPGLACLWGSWLAIEPSAGASVLILSRPRATARDVGALDTDRLAAGRTDAPAGVIGGGWVGWLGYDAGDYFAFYDHLLRFDDDTGRWSFEALWTRRRASALRARREEWTHLLQTLAEPSAPAPVPISATSPIGELSGPSRARHLAAVEAAIGLIRAGEIYQVNICTRVRADFSGSTADAARLFADAASTLRPRFGAFIDGDERTVLSLSPELFLRREGDRVTSSPIKGTWRRDPGDPSDDGADRLRHSTKDIAENVMIVDLVRNDLGRVGRPGTVRVEALLGIQPHPGIWHLVSTVSARLRPSTTDVDLVAATFPPGSVTGTPKVRALAAIADIEDGPRGVYTGALGIAGPAAGLALSVAIRTFEITRGPAGATIELGVGGGITADSVPELEWRECVQKAQPLLRALGAGSPRAFTETAATPPPELVAGGLIETILAVGGTVLRLADHLARLDRSARELYGLGVPPTVAEQVQVAASAWAGSDIRVAIRVVLSPAGAVRVQAAAAGPRPSGSAVVLATRPGVWRHKWADRSWATAYGPAEQLFVGADGTALETTRGNVFVVDAYGGLMTAPLRDDLLPGVTRRAVLDLARDRGWPARIEPFPVESVETAAAAFWTSSLSGVVPITSVDGRALVTEARAARRLDAISIGLGFGPCG